MDKGDKVRVKGWPDLGVGVVFQVQRDEMEWAWIEFPRPVVRLESAPTITGTPLVIFRPVSSLEQVED